MPQPLPTHYTKESLVTSEGLSQYSDHNKNFVMDRPVETVLSFPNILTAGPLAIQSLGNGNPPITDINTSDIGGLVFTTADIHGFQVPLPYGLDVERDVDFRIRWMKVQAAAAATGACLWGLSYATHRVGVTPLAAATVALNTIIPSQVDLAQYVDQWTGWGTINGGTLSALTAGTDCLDFSLLATLDTITDGTLMEVQMRYYRRLI